MVTIIITTYNRDEYLKLCLDSLLSQSYSDFKIVIISDGYFQSTELLIDSYNDPKISLIFNTHTGLPAVSRNIGISHVKTDYLCFCDDDDVWHKDKLRDQISLISTNDFDLIHTNIELIDSNSIPIILPSSFATVLNKIYTSFLMYFRLGILFKNYICLSSVLIKTEVTRHIRFNESINFRGTEDYIFWIEAIFNDFNFYFLNKKLVGYRIHTNNISKDKVAAYKRTLSAIDLMLDKYGKKMLYLILSKWFYNIKRLFL